MSILYEKFKKYQVPASSVEDFRRRYTKPDRFAPVSYTHLDVYKRQGPASPPRSRPRP